MGMLLDWFPFEGERIVLPPSGRRRSHSKKRKGWPGKCLGKGGDNPLKFTTIFGNDHLSPNGEDAHSDVDMAHKTARALCTDLCHHFHQWCLAIELKAPVAAGRGQHHPPECSLVTDEETFDQAGGTLHDARWGGRQHFHNDVHLYLTYCGGAGCSFHHAGDWNGGKVNDAAGFQCFPAIGFDDEYAFNPDRLLDEDGKALKPGYNHGKKHHRGMGRASAGDAEQEKIIAQQEEDSAIDELKKMRADLDEKLANLEKLEAARKNRRTKKE